MIECPPIFAFDLSRRACLRTIGTATVAALAASVSRAQESRVVRIVLPLPVGNSVDAAVRMLADALRTTSGRNYVVDNKPGAGGLMSRLPGLGGVFRCLWTPESDGSRRRR